MIFKTEIVSGKKRITIISKASGVDKTREAVLAAMGPGFVYKGEQEQKIKEIKNDRNN